MGRNPREGKPRAGGQKGRVAAGVALLLLAAAAPAQRSGGGPPRPSQPAEPKPPTAERDLCSIEGHVVSAATGEPVRKAIVTLRPFEMRPGPGGMPPTPLATSTDAGGRFVLSRVEPGRYRLSVSRNGFVQAEYGSRGGSRGGATLTLERAGRITGLQFKLTPHAVVTGRVFDEDGEPVAYAGVTALRYRYTQEGRQLSPSGSAMTNDLGEYRLFGIAPGKYYIAANYRTGGWEPSVNQSPDADTGYAPTYYPGTVDANGAAPVDLAAGAQLRGLDIGLARIRTVRVRGRVVDPSGTGARRVQVMLMPKDRTRVMGWDRQARIDAQGNFELRGVAPGAYTAVAFVYDRDRPMSARQPISVGSGDLENVTLPLQPSFDLAGRIKAEGGDTPAFTDTAITLRPKDGDMMFGTAGGRAAEDGSFTIRGASANLYDVMVAGLPAGYYVKSIRLGDADALEHGADLSAGAPGALEIVARAGAGQIEGAALNAKKEPVSGATAVLIPSNPRRQPKTASTDQNGRYSMTGIEPGDYKLYVWEDVEPGAWLDPDFLRAVESRGESVKIDENARKTLDATVIPPGAQ